MNILTSTLEAKRLGLLRELVPQAATIGILKGVPSIFDASLGYVLSLLRDCRISSRRRRRSFTASFV
jgi:hypothetical protein